MYRLFRVRGRSMLPTLGDGDFVLGRRIAPNAVRRLDTDAIVCVDHPHYGPLIKRIDHVDGDVVHLSSDGVTGTDGRALGQLTVAHITHRARWLIRARGGVRRL